MLNVNEIVSAQKTRYPLSRTRDYIKALYQAEFGCGHLLDGNAEGCEWLKREALSAKMGKSLIEPLNDTFCRYHLSTDDVARAETIYRLFTASGQRSYGNIDEFVNALRELKAMLGDADASAEIDNYIALGCPATHHSDTFRSTYSPTYRVMLNDYARYIDQFCRLDALLSANKRLTVAIDGRCASGKTTFAELISGAHDCNVFHMDDFFLRLEQRTPERYAEPGGNVDRERFISDVLMPLKGCKPFSYRVFDCSTMALGDTVEVESKALNIIEGSYSMHPDLRAYYDYSFFFTVDPEIQSKRIMMRNGPEKHTRFVNEWIPYEEKYFNAFDVASSCDEIVATTENE